MAYSVNISGQKQRTIERFVHPSPKRVVERFPSPRKNRFVVLIAVIGVIILLWLMWFFLMRKKKSPEISGDSYLTSDSIENPDYY